MSVTDWGKEIPTNHGVIVKCFYCGKLGRGYATKRYGYWIPKDVRIEKHLHSHGWKKVSGVWVCSMCSKQVIRS